jgi:c-di-GMP-binding flagellar brake protein YcgR
MRKKKEVPVKPPSERRKDSRVSEEDKVVIELFPDLQPPPQKKIFSALTKDISPGGVRLMTNVALPVNTPVRMEIVLSKRRKLIQATGIVRWSRSVYEADLFEMGVEFTEIALEDKMILLEHTYKKR